MLGQLGGRRRPPVPHEAQRLLTKAATLIGVKIHPKMPGQLSVVAQLGMGVQRQVVGQAG